MTIGSADRAESTVVDERRRYLAFNEVSLSPRERLVIAGVLRPDTVSDLEPDARVVALLPHDADLVLERTDPDLVLIESSALAPGNAWAGAGEPSVADVARRLLRVLDVAVALGRPTVLWWNGPRTATPGAIPFESRFDFVLGSELDGDRIDMAWSPGVQLARFSPIGIGAERPFHPVAHGRWDQVEARGVRSFMDGAAVTLSDEGLELWIDAEAVAGPTWLPGQHRAADVRRVSTTELPDRYRGHGLFLAQPLTEPAGQHAVSTSTLRQLASGARVVSGPNPALAPTLGEWIDWAADPAGVPAAVRSAGQHGPRPAPELRALLRRLFLEHGTTSASARLATLIGVRGLKRRRDVAVVTRFGDGVRPERFLDSVSLQALRPSEALIAVDDPADARTAVAELDRSGIRARALQPPRLGQGLARWAAGYASAEWLWVWSPQVEHDPRFLLDAVIHGVMTGAAAIGRGDGVESGFVDGSGLTGPVVSREAALRLPDPGDAPLTAWHERGATVYAVGTDPGDG